jgi:hypothetical protein
MPAILDKRRYRIVGDLVLRDRDGLPRHFATGDELPPDIAATFSRQELAIHLSIGKLQEIGAPPPRHPPPEPPKPPTVVDILRNTGWSSAAVVDGKIENGPRGYTFTVLGRAVRESDLKQIAGVGRPISRDTPALIHVVDGEPVVTIPLAKLAPLLLTTFGMR